MRDVDRMSEREARLPVRLRINGESVELQARMHDSLLDVLRDNGWMGTKRVCETADCGACAVQVDGRVLDACITLVWQVEDCEIRTVEGMAATALHPLQRAFLQEGAAQCGFCTPGMLLTLENLLATQPDASDAAIREAMPLCRCTGYVQPVRAVRRVRDAGAPADPPGDPEGKGSA